jgi:hypothetical protein
MIALKPFPNEIPSSRSLYFGSQSMFLVKPFPGEISSDDALDKNS